MIKAENSLEVGSSCICMRSVSCDELQRTFSWCPLIDLSYVYMVFGGDGVIASKETLTCHTPIMFYLVFFETLVTAQTHTQTHAE